MLSIIYIGTIGEDGWRQVSEEDLRMQPIDEELRMERVQPLSKPRDEKLANGSVWTKLHFSILLPCLRKLKSVYTSHPFLQNGVLTMKESESFTDIFPNLIHALRRYNDALGIENEFRKLIQTSNNKEAFVNNFRDYTLKLKQEENLSFKEQFMCSFYDQIVASKSDINYNLLSSCDIEQLFHTVLQCMPDKPSDLVPFFQTLLTLAITENDVLGRLFIYYYSVERKVSHTELGVLPQVESYFLNSVLDVYRRVAHYLFFQLPSCPFQLVHNEVPESIPIKTLFELYAEWYQRPKVVEMVLPNFVGAGRKTSKYVINLVEFIRDSTEGKIDCTQCIFQRRGKTGQQNVEGLVQGLRVNISSLVKDMDCLRRFGRLAMYMECIGNGKLLDCIGASVPPMNNEDLLSLCYAIWDSKSREDIWGHVDRYVPIVSNENFASFKQDVAPIIYAASINIEDHFVDEKCKSLVQNLRSLSRYVLDSTNSIQDIRMFLRKQNYCEYLNDAIKYVRLIEKDIDLLDNKNCSRSILYLYRLFIADVSPVYIPLPEIYKGFTTFYMEQSRDNVTLAIEFHEAGDRIIFSITRDKKACKKINFTYSPSRFEHDGLPYPDSYILNISDEHSQRSVRIPKLGRECYDLLGEAGSPHSGLVIGYGCSVFHCSLQFAQIVASHFGFYEPEHLYEIQKQFFRINPSLHKRYHLATFHTEQLLQAIHKTDSPQIESTEDIIYDSLSYRQYTLQNFMPLISENSLHFHCYDFVKSDDENSLLIYKQQLAFLQYHYIDLYPVEQGDKEQIDPRTSFYDGSCVKLSFDNSFTVFESLFQH